MAEWRKVPLNRERPHLEASDEGEFRIIHLSGETVYKKLDKNGYIRWMRLPLIKGARALALAFPERCAYAVVPPISSYKELPGDIKGWNVMLRDNKVPLKPDNIIWARPGFNPEYEAKVLRALEYLDADEEPEKAAGKAGISLHTLEKTLRGEAHEFAVQRRAYLIDNLKWRIPNCDPRQIGKSRSKRGNND